MKRKGKAGTIFITAGSLLLAAALLLVGYNLYDEYRAGQTANHVLEALQQQMPETPSDDLQTPENSILEQTEIPDYVLNPDMEMPTQEIEGNDRTHFGPVRDVSAGTQVFFTDVKGRRFSYEVSAVETIEATAIEDAVSEAWDLTLITCTPGGQARVAVHCIKIN